MWENRCKVAVSGVGFSKVTRSAEIPLAAHALAAVKEAVADSGLQMSDIDGLATYPELPATGHAEVDGISIVSVNCMMAMLKLPDLGWHIQVGTTNIGGAVQQAANALLAGVCKYAVVWRAMHNPRGTYQNLPGAYAQGAAQFTAPYGFGGPGQGMAVAYTRWLERNNQNREKMATLAVTQRRHTQHNPHAYFYGTRADARGLPELADGRLSVLPVRLRHPGAGGGRDRLDHGRAGARPEAAPAYLAGYGQRLHFEVAGRIGSLSSYMEGGSSSAKLTWERSGFGPEGRRRRPDLRRLLGLGDLRSRKPTVSAGKARRSISSRTAASNSTANCRSTPLAAASAPAASTACGTSSRAPCRPRAAPARARSRTPTSPSSAPAPRSSPARPSSSCASPIDAEM